MHGLCLQKGGIILLALLSSHILFPSQNPMKFLSHSCPASGLFFMSSASCFLTPSIDCQLYPSCSTQVALSFLSCPACLMTSVSLLHASWSSFFTSCPICLAQFSNFLSHPFSFSFLRASWFLILLQRSVILHMSFPPFLLLLLVQGSLPKCVHFAKKQNIIFRN